MVNVVIILLLLMVRTDITPTPTDTPPGETKSKMITDARAYVLELTKLFQTHHSFSNERLLWLCFWVGTKAFEQDLITKETVETRIAFLRSAWTNFREFRPFDDVQTSENYLLANPELGYILRLSTSQPGKITFTRPRPTGAGIVHTRYTVITDGRIVNASGNIFANLHHLAQELSSTLAAVTPHYQPAEYVPNNPPKELED